jgi:hypothetical protein
MRAAESLRVVLPEDPTEAGADPQPPPKAVLRSPRRPSSGSRAVGEDGRLLGERFVKRRCGTSSPHAPSSWALAAKSKSTLQGRYVGSAHTSPANRPGVGDHTTTSAAPQAGELVPPAIPTE